MSHWIMRKNAIRGIGSIKFDKKNGYQVLTKNGEMFEQDGILHLIAKGEEEAIFKINEMTITIKKDNTWTLIGNVKNSFGRSEMEMTTIQGKPLRLKRNDFELDISN